MVDPQSEKHGQKLEIAQVRPSRPFSTRLLPLHVTDASNDVRDADWVLASQDVDLTPLCSTRAVSVSSKPKARLRHSGGMKK